MTYGGDFCNACGASVPPREGEGTCSKCEPFNIDRELAWSHATALGEAAWRRMCIAGKRDAKDLRLSRMHDTIVGFVRDAAFVLESDGFEGLATWLEVEGVNEQ